MTDTQTNAREAAIDTEIAKTHGAYMDAIMHLGRVMQTVHYKAGDKQQRRIGWGMSDQQALDTARARLAAMTEATMPHLRRETEQALAKHDEAAVAVVAAGVTYRQAEERYGGWSRFFLVANANGHIHSSMHCSTCFPTTAYAWLPKLSGLTEAEAVDAHGTRLCSVCYPSAPVEWTVGIEADTSGRCKGSGEYALEENLSRNRRYAHCTGCANRAASVTSTGKVRAHKPA